MATWTLNRVKIKDFDNIAREVVAWVSSDATPQFLVGSLLYGPNGGTNDTVMAAQVLSGNNGDGLATVVLNEVPIVGMGQDGVEAHALNYPVRVGGTVETSLAAVTPLLQNQIAGFVTDATRRQVTVPYSNPESTVDGTTSTTGNTAVELIAAAAAGVRTYLTGLVLANTHATTGTRVEILDGATAIRQVLPCPANYQGAPIRFDPPLRGTAATAWNVRAADAVSTIYASATGYRSKL